MELAASSDWSRWSRDLTKQTIKPNKLHLAILMFILLISISLGRFTVGDDANGVTNGRRLKIVSLAHNLESDFYRRFNGSASRLELDYEIVNQDKQMLSVDSVRSALSNHRDHQDLIILLALDDRLVLNGNEVEFLEKFNLFGANKIVFAGNLNRHATLTPTPNCRALIGSAPELWKLFDGDNKDIEVDLHCARVFADEERRKSLGLTVDQKFEIFQPLVDFSGQESKLKLVESLDRCELHNLATLTKPVVILPSSQAGLQDSSTHLLNSLGNYLGLAWTRRSGSRVFVNETSASDSSPTASETRQPGLLIGLFILEPTPFLEHFFELVLELDWPRRENVHLILYNSIEWHQPQVDTFRARVSQLPFASFKILSPTTPKVEKSISTREPGSGEDDANDKISISPPPPPHDHHNRADPADKKKMPSSELEWDLELAAHNAELEARSAALEHCKQLGFSKCDYYLHLESLARIGASDLVRELISVNQTFVAPMLTRPARLWANFWGSQTADNYYARSFDYVDLVKRDKVGLWAVALARDAYLLEASFIRSELSPGSHSRSSWHPLSHSHLPGHLETSAESNSVTGGDPDQNQKINKDQNESSNGEAKKIDHRHYYFGSLGYLSAGSSHTLPRAGNSRELRAQMRVNYAISMARQLQALGKLQFVLNTRHFGHLVDPTSYDLNKTRPDLYQLEDNILDWEREYLHPNYSRIFDEDPNHQENLRKSQRIDGVSHLISERVQQQASDTNSSSELPAGETVEPNPFIEEPCRDVFWFPLVSERFTQDMIAVMEAFGRWSAGTNDDPRIEGGYESVPTRDIHFRQVGLHEQWLQFLRYYVMPVQLRQFIGYEHDPPRADLAFVVRYHPREQPSLRPHHDSSTYTLNVALNSPELGHYEGGGCRFVRQSCSVTQSRAGWALIHPGRLTHYHEGLPVRAGTRYILVTFVDP